MKILIVDDEPLIRRSLEKIFKRKEYTVAVAKDGDDGFVQWKDFNPDIVILDVLMPGCSGPEVIEKVKPAKNIGVILMSAFSGEYNLDSAKKHGADDFISKPFDSLQEIVLLAEQLYSEKNE